MTKAEARQVIAGFVLQGFEQVWNERIAREVPPEIIDALSGAAQEFLAEMRARAAGKPWPSLPTP